MHCTMYWYYNYVYFVAQRFVQFDEAGSDEETSSVGMLYLSRFIHVWWWSVISYTDTRASPSTSLYVNGF